MKGDAASAGKPVDEYAGVVEYLRVFGHAGFFVFRSVCSRPKPARFSP